MLMPFLLMLMIPILVNVAFFTLLERKILGLAQSRKGPNKVSTGGVLQPFSDAVKLFLKEMTKPLESNWMFFLTPALGLMLVLMIWTIAPLQSKLIHPEFSSMILLVILSLSLYPLLLAGWSSNSKYALIGAIRGVAQTLSYEISLALVFFCFFTYSSSFDLWKITCASNNLMPLFLALPLFCLWIISCVAETNRTPFDFAEGESELVSGFNIEFGGGAFALIFMTEYASIMFFSLLTAQFMGVSNNIILSIFTLYFCFMWVWIRATLPRFRYDMLMNMAWKVLLPSALAMSWFFFFMAH